MQDPSSSSLNLWIEPERLQWELGSQALDRQGSLKVLFKVPDFSDFCFPVTWGYCNKVSVKMLTYTVFFSAQLQYHCKAQCFTISFDNKSTLHCAFIV